MKVVVKLKGGPGSGHYGHAGRPGKVGGSIPSAFAGINKADTFYHPSVHEAMEKLIPGSTVRYGTYEPLRDSISGQAPTGLVVELGGTELFVSVYEDYAIFIRTIEASKTGTGLGTKFMEALKKYADFKGKDVTIYRVTNSEFYRKFDWLQEDAFQQEFHYAS